MQGKQFIRALSLKNLLSFGNEGVSVALQPLNVIIGPNGSGKSNLIEAIGLLQATPTDLTRPIREGGGVSEWLWKGEAGPGLPVAEVEAIIQPQDRPETLRHRFAFMEVNNRIELVDEVVEFEYKAKPSDPEPYFFYKYQSGHPVLNVMNLGAGMDEPSIAKRVRRTLRREDLKPDQSVLSQRKDPDLYPEISYIAREYHSIMLYTEWNLGRRTPPRLAQSSDLEMDFLLPDASNLALVLNNLQTYPQVFQNIIKYLRLFYDRLENIVTRINFGTVQVYFQEKGLRQLVPATRLSDGTLRFLCLLTILLHPSPPPLVCIEEPELGMHPDILPTIAELCIEASGRTQLIVTTHSDILISMFADFLDAILVCERDDKGTALQHLDRAELQTWLKDYSLGDAWLKGAFGGTRW